jgi:hypothetical protein
MKWFSSKQALRLQPASLPNPLQYRTSIISRQVDAAVNPAFSPKEQDPSAY